MPSDLLATQADQREWPAVARELVGDREVEPVERGGPMALEEGVEHRRRERHEIKAARPDGIDAGTLEVAREVTRRESGHVVEGARLLEQVRRAWDDLQLRGASEPCLRVAVEQEDLAVELPDDQQRRCGDPRQDCAGATAP